MIAFLFPGQGVQQKNMLSLIKEFSPEIDDIFRAASDAAGRDVKALCASENLIQLTKTENAQPAITAMNCAFFTLLKQRGITPDVVAGHSLGQYSALMCAGALSMQDGFRLVARRAELMSQVQKKGKLCAVIGLDVATVEEVCQKTGCQIALRNAPNQIVVGGEEKNVEAAALLADSKGALKTELLAVENAFHTDCMKEMEASFRKEIEKTVVKTPTCDILLNCKGGLSSGAEDIKKDLIEQCCHAVLWDNCMKYLVSQNVDCAYEVGVGNVLGGLLKRQNRKIVIKNILTEV